VVTTLLPSAGLCADLRGFKVDAICGVRRSPTAGGSHLRLTVGDTRITEGAPRVEDRSTAPNTLPAPLLAACMRGVRILTRLEVHPSVDVCTKS
jgi:hypothetical protein